MPDTSEHQYNSEKDATYVLGSAGFAIIHDLVFEFRKN